MKLSYTYPGPSVCVSGPGATTLGLSPDLSREEKVSFRGRLRHPLVFRDAMLMLREIVISDSRMQKKERPEFFQWLEGEIDRRVLEHGQHMPGLREQLQADIDAAKRELAGKDDEIIKLTGLRESVGKEIDSYDTWGDYNKLEREFWKFIRNRNPALWFVLDPVITVHKDQVSFEAFSQDESIYGCLSIEMDEFELLQEPALGTTNIDFSQKLAREMERFRTYSNVELSVAPEGFAVDTGAVPEYIEKKIDLPETWIKGFNQVSAAASMPGGTSVTLSPVDMYDICSFLRRHKAHSSPRYMKWDMEKDKPVRIVFEPFGKELVLSETYTGDKAREERIWGRRRWLVAEKLIPLAKSFEVRLLGFGMPQFIIADLGPVKLTIGFSAWSANDWVRGTAFNIMSGYIGDGNYKKVHALLQERRAMSIDEICASFDAPRAKTISGIGGLLRRGEGYFDAVHGLVRFRRLTSEPLPAELYETTPAERAVESLLKQGLDSLRITWREGAYHFTIAYNDDGKTYEPSIAIDEDGQILQPSCSCRTWKRGPRNISAPCPHILALYIASARFTKLRLEPGREYRTNDIMELLL